MSCPRVFRLFYGTVSSTEIDDTSAAPKCALKMPSATTFSDRAAGRTTHFQNHTLPRKQAADLRRSAAREQMDGVRSAGSALDVATPLAVIAGAAGLPGPGGSAAGRRRAVEPIAEPFQATLVSVHIVDAAVPIQPIAAIEAVGRPV